LISFDFRGAADGCGCDVRNEVRKKGQREEKYLDETTNKIKMTGFY
jgi:hypothetical protein